MTQNLHSTKNKRKNLIVTRINLIVYLLGICLGPSLLWESAQNAPLRTLPTLIEMIINNCQALFGTQVVSLLGEVAHDSGAEESDSLHCKYFNDINVIPSKCFTQRYKSTDILDLL